MKYFFIILLLALAVAGALWYLGFVPIKEDIAGEEPRNLPEIEERSEIGPLNLTPEEVIFEDGSIATFMLADGFDMHVAAEGLGKVRFMASSPDGRLFVPDLVNYNLSHQGQLWILDDFDLATKEFRKKSIYLSNLRGPNSIAFYTDNSGQEWLYLALTDTLIRYKYETGDLKPSSEPEVVATFPDWQSEGASSVVWHITRTILFHEDNLFVSIGSGCNACEQPKEEMRGAVLRMDPDGKNMKIYADGLRNAVGIEWAEDSLYATENGVDHFGAHAPDDLMYKITEGEHYAWPYCYELGGEILEDNSKSWEREHTICGEAPHSFAAFSPHSAPLGLAYFAKGPPKLKEHFLVALHGSFDPEVKSGYQVLRVSLSGEKEIFLDGLQTKEGVRIARPVDFLMFDEKSFFMTDDHGGRIFYLQSE